MGVAGINHTATMTTDLEHHAEFYGDIFGAKVTFTMDAAPDHPVGVDSLAELQRVKDGWSPQAPTSARSRISAASGRCSSATSTAMELEMCAHIDGQAT